MWLSSGVNVSVESEILESDKMIDKLSPLAYNEDSLYLAAENVRSIYKDIRFTSDHMAVLGSVGILPMNKLIRADYMKNTLHWVWTSWSWAKTSVITMALIHITFIM